MADTLIAQKIESLIRCITRIETKRPELFTVLENDIDLQDIISVNLERAVQQAVDCAMIILSNRGAEVPATMGEAFDELRLQGILTEKTSNAMKKAVGFRNLIVHAYRKIDWSIVWEIITGNMDDFRSFVADVMQG